MPIFVQAQDTGVSYKMQDNISIEKRGVVNLRAAQDDFLTQLTHLEAPAVGGDSYRGFLRELKQEHLPKFLEENEFPEAAPLKTAENFELLQGMNFRGNPFNGIPGDNDMAISNDGMLVSVVNSSIWVTDVNDPSFDEVVTGLAAFSADLDLSTNRFDPKVLYDPNADRFILICLAGSMTTEFIGGQTDEQTIVIGFSESNDPTDDWNVYALTGIPLMNGTWSDYPQIAISERELFITVNLIQDNVPWYLGFTQSVIWQVFMQDGYTGSSNLNSRLYSDIKHNDEFIRYICPIKDADLPEGDNMYFLSNESYIVEEDTFTYEFQNDELFLLEVSGLQFSNSTELIIDALQTDIPYGVAPLAAQPEGLFLNTNDARILGGYFHNGNIHWVGNSISLPSEKSAIYHGRILDVGGANTVIGAIIDDPVLELGYPNISYTGIGFDDQNIITFLHAGESVFPGMSGIGYGEGTYSDILTIKEGGAFLTYTNGALDKRWGDYSGSQRKYNEPGVVWVNGTFGTNESTANQNVYGTWVSQLTSTFGGQATGIDEADEIKASVYPNPSREVANVEFEMPDTQNIEARLISIDGKVIDTVFRGRAKAGRNLISFLTESLAPGTYILNIENAKSESIYNEQLIVQR